MYFRDIAFFFFGFHFRFTLQRYENTTKSIFAPSQNIVL